MVKRFYVLISLDRIHAPLHFFYHNHNETFIGGKHIFILMKCKESGCEMKSLITDHA